MNVNGTWPESSEGGRLGDGRHAHATDRPADLDALRQVVATRVSEGHALYPQGGCSALDYGGPPRSPGVAIDLRGLNRVIDYPAADMTITVEAGLTVAELGRTLEEYRQKLWIDVPQADRATLGGVFATDTSGPRRFGYRRPRDQIIGMSFVTSEGQVVKGGGRVVKNVAGYDFPKLLTGSMGTLGIIGQMTLKVRPLPEASAVVWAGFDHADDVANTLDRLNTSATRPVAVELMNRSGALLVGEPLGLPSREWVLALGFEDNAESVAWQLSKIREELEGSEVEIREGADARPLWSALTESQVAEVGPLTWKASMRLSAVVPYVRLLDPERWAVQAHAGNGIVRGHLRGDAERDELAPEIDRLRAEAVRQQGNLTLPRCPTAWKPGLRVWGEPRPDWALAQRIKQALDPTGALNPGRFVGTI